MADKRSYPTGTTLYVFGVVACGAAVVSVSALQLFETSQSVPGYRGQWLALVALTIVTGLLPITRSGTTTHVGISVSETFIIAGTLLFGREGGTVLVLLDALFISLYLLSFKGLRWQPLLFNLTAPPLSIWLASWAARLHPQFGTTGDFDWFFILQLTAFTTLYFLVNTWLITIAMALQQRVRPWALWWNHFRELLLNYTAGGSIAALLVYNTRQLKWEFVLAIIPLLVVLFLTYQWTNKRVQIERDRNAELNRVFLSTIEALALAIDAKDQVTHGHIRRVQRYTIALAKALGVNDDKQLDAIRAAALLHDTGKLAVPEYILNKPGPLTAAEFERMKMHASVGADILKSIDFPYPVEPIVRHHHENWDGTGYPSGLNGQEIPLGARILSVVDCYDALTSDRPYRPRYTRQHAELVLRERAGTFYDPLVVEGFIRLLDDLERQDAEDDMGLPATHSAQSFASTRLDVITATTAEEREFGELRRELPLSVDTLAAADVLFRHLQRVIPLANLTVFAPGGETADLTAVASCGVARSVIEGLRIPVGERVSGWVLAHKQPVVNSNAILEIGPIARTLQTPLRYALSVPALSGPGIAVAVLTCYGTEPFELDHRRILEAAATLFAASAGSAAGPGKPFGFQAQRTSSRVH